MTKDYSDEDERELDGEAIRELDPAQQAEVMRRWFLKHFEDPAERTPYESAEGGYQWIWGGPHEALEELSSEFSDYVAHETIQKLASELNDLCPEWAPAETPEDYADHAVEDIARIPDHSDIFDLAIEDIKTLLKVRVPGRSGSCLHRLLYVNVISALETYLGDTFISKVEGDRALLRRFLKTTPELRGRKVPLSSAFSARRIARKAARQYLVDTVWHDLARVRNMYKDTLRVDFPRDRKDLFVAVRIRHDVVHRNGKTKDGKLIAIPAKEVTALIAAARKLVRHIEDALSLF